MNKHGITLTILVITIVLMSILVITGGTAVVKLIKRANEQNLISNMVLIQSQVKIIMERVAFNGDESQYIGTKLKTASNKQTISDGVLTKEELESDSIYIYNRQALNSLGLNKINLNNGDFFLVDYSNADVIFPKGLQREDGSMLYRLSQVNENEASYNKSNMQVVTFESGTDYINAQVFMNKTQSNITDYKFLIATTEAGVKQQTGSWIQLSNYRFENLSSNTNYYIMVKIKNSAGEEQTSKIYRVKTQ